MPLTDEQAFKVGFLKKCAEDGLTIDETKQRVKLAIHVLQKAKEKQAIFGLETAQELAGKGLGLATTTAPLLLLGGPMAAGGLAGYAAAKGLHGNKDVVEEAKGDEIVGEYERLADEARRRARLKQLQALTGRRVVALSPGETT
jgi:hypothetical protein